MDIRILSITGHVRNCVRTWLVIEHFQFAIFYLFMHIQCTCKPFINLHGLSRQCTYVRTCMYAQRERERERVMCLCMACD